MASQHVTFDLPHGTFHALQAGAPDGQPTIVLHGFPVDHRHRFAARHAMEVVPDVGHFLHIEAPEAIAERIAAWAE